MPGLQSLCPWALASCLDSTLLTETFSVTASPICIPQGVDQDVLQAIDRAIEAVHNTAMRDGGKYSLEQRGVLQ